MTISEREMEARCGTSANTADLAMTRARSIWIVALFALFLGMLIYGFAIGNPFETYQNGTALDLLSPEEE